MSTILEPGPFIGRLGVTPSTAPRRVRSASTIIRGAWRHRVARPLRWCFLRGEALARTQPLLFSLTHVLLLMALTMSIFQVGFDTNDDAVMEMFASGRGLAVAPSEYLIFTNIVIGHGLKWLYERAPTIPWYGLYLYGTHWLSAGALLYGIISLRYTRLRLMAFWLLFITVESYFLVNVQFTTTGCLAGFAGVGLLMTALQSHLSDQGRVRWGLCIAAALVIAWGGLIRNDTFFLTAALAVPVLVVMATVNDVGFRVTLPVCTAYIVATGLFLAAQQYHTARYAAEPGWNDFYRYNQLRVKFNDEGWVRYDDDSEHAFRAAGWNRNDLYMIQNWFYDDGQYDYDKLAAVWNGHDWQGERRNLGSLAGGLWEIYQQSVSIALLCSMPLMLLFVERRATSYAVIATAVMTSFGLLLYLILFRKTPPPRVFVPVLAYPLLVSWFFVQFRTPSAESRRRLWKVFVESPHQQPLRLQFDLLPRRWLGGVLLGLALVGISTSIYKQYRRGRERLKEAVRLEEMLAAIRKENPAMTVCWSSTFPYEAISPFTNGTQLSGLRLFSLGWPQRTPYAEQMKQELGIDNLAVAMATREDLLQVGIPATFYLHSVFVKDHYQLDISHVSWYADRRSMIGRCVKNLPPFQYYGQYQKDVEQLLARLSTFVSH